MEYRIKRVETEEEMEEVYRIMQDAFREYCKYDTPSSAMNEKLSTLKDAIHHGTEEAIIGLINGNPVGAVRFKEQDEDSLYFFRLSVLPKARGKGMAKKMLEWLVENAEKNKKGKVVCRVRKDTPQNIRFYEANQFVIAREETIINKDGNIVDTVMMEKRTKVLV